MHTKYIKYLQSMNNANSSNDNAIAESQFSNPFYEQIRVVKKGEIVGFTGLAGDGRTELFESIFGYRKKYTGEIKI